jgi:SagB-type dehydrogenase family enzyme
MTGSTPGAHGAARTAASPAALTTDEAYAYTSGLREDPTSANGDGWHVDWADGPWPVKVYDGGERLPLRAATGPLAAVARLLAGTTAVTRVRFDRHGGLPATPENPAPPRRAKAVLRRPVPSGGSMYPTEAYVLLTAENRLCHHDPYRHELTDLRHPSARAALAAALGTTADALPAAVLVLTNRFWKNFYKYGEFACRLGAVDVGVVLGRALRLGGACFGTAGLHTGFDDAAVNACLGLDGRDESAYAVIGLGPAAGCPATETGAEPGAAHPLPDPPPVIERSGRIKRSARFDAMHAAACAPTRPEAAAPAPGDAATSATPLPHPAPPDLLDPATLVRRASRGRFFNGGTATAGALATVLQATAALGADPARRLGTHLELYCAVHRVAGVPPGWYRYRPGPGDLVPTGAGRDPGCAREVQDALHAKSLNIELAAFTVHVATPLDWRGGGPRAYREQQMAVGVAVEAATLAAEAAGLSGHPVLGFDALRMDRAYGLHGGALGTQAQISAGTVRPDPNWETSVRTG